MRILNCFLISLLLGCSSGQIKPSSQIDTVTTSLKADTSKESENGTEDFRKEFIESYQQPISIDTSYVANGTKYKVLFHHFCTMDNGLIIPAKYNFDTNKDFVTHNFISELTLLNENDTVFKKQITKETFDKLLDSSLKNYGALLYPNFEITNDTIQITYSISIPVTDVGIAVNIKFDNKGNYVIGK